MNADPGLNERQVAEMVRRELRLYVSSLSRRVVPIFAIGALLLAVALGAPTKLNPDLGTGSTQTGSGPGSTAGTANGIPSPSASGGPVTGSTAGGIGALAPFTGTFASSDIAKSGVKCGPGVLQVTFTPRAPACLPAWTGNNGGATAHGVTGTTINLVLRIDSADPAEQAIFEPGQQVASEFQVFANYFNKVYETYGRKVVVSTFNGQSNVALDIEGHTPQTSRADAQTVYDKNGFVTSSSVVGDYKTALVQDHVIVVAPNNYTRPALIQEAPYDWAVGTGYLDDWGRAVGTEICQRMKGLPAIFDGDNPSAQRVYGLVYPNSPDYVPGAMALKSTVENCGIQWKYEHGYTVDPATESNEAAQVIANMRLAGVTTVGCLCDTIFQPALLEAANGQGGAAAYHPEWLGLDHGEGITRLFPAGQNVIITGSPGKEPKASSLEGYRVYKLASGGAEPASGTAKGPANVNTWFQVMAIIFGGIQNAGPDLTPATFARGVQEMQGAPAEGGNARWLWGRNIYNPTADTTLTYWDPNGTSNYDGKQGTTQVCDGGIRYNVYQLNLGSDQLHCYGH